MTTEHTTESSGSYVPDRVERVGRRLKMEYVGMGSVFVVIALLIFGGLGEWPQIIAATAATFFLFLGLKKKTRDHLVTSFLMFTAAGMAQGAVAAAHWAVPFMLFGALVWALEGYMEKRQNRFWVLPLAFVPWVTIDASWILGLVYFAIYLTYPWSEKPGLRRRLALVFLASLIVAGGTAAFRGGAAAFEVGARLPLDTLQMGLMALVGLPVLICLALYWSKLEAPRKWNALIFVLLAPWDARLLAIFGIPGTVLLGATVFRNSADSDRIRLFLKHAEWYFFWVVFAVAVWALIERAA